MVSSIGLKNFSLLDRFFILFNPFLYFKVALLDYIL